MKSAAAAGERIGGPARSSGSVPMSTDDVASSRITVGVGQQRAGSAIS